MSQFYILFQRLLPKFLLGRLVHRLSRVEVRWVKNLLIRAFVRAYPVDVDAAAAPVPDGYASFNAFFTRTLKPGARPVDPDPAAVGSPADGAVERAGALEQGCLLQAKGHRYSVAALLGSEAAAANYRDGGTFVTIYLAPQDYHRVHAPIDGTLEWMRYVPGNRWSVNTTTSAAIPGLFAANERLVCRFRFAGGHWDLVLVGALNVASISTAWAGEILPRRPREMHDWPGPADAPVRVARGDVVGQFNMGSTVIALFPGRSVQLDAALGPGQVVRTNAAIGRCRT